jgi:hypothetical protein
MFLVNNKHLTENCHSRFHLIENREWEQCQLSSRQCSPILRTNNKKI